MASAEGLSSEDLKASLYAHLKQSGTLKSLKTQLRAQVFADLSKRGGAVSPKTSPGKDVAAAAPLGLNTDNALMMGMHENGSFAHLCNALIESHLRATGREYSNSVFMTETGAPAGDQGADAELATLLRLQQYRPDAGESPLAVLVKEMGAERRLHLCVDAASTQTYETELELEHRLALVEAQFSSRQMAMDKHSRSELETRIRKHEIETEKRLQQDFESYKKQWKENEEAKIRRDEELKYRSLVHDKLVEVAELERKMRHTLSTEEMKVQQLKRELDMRQLSLESDRNDLLKAAQLRDNANKSLMNEVAELREKARAAESRSLHLEDLLQAQIQETESTVKREDRRHQERINEVKELMRDVASRDETIAELRFQLRTMCDDCAQKMNQAHQHIAAVQHQRELERLSQAATNQRLAMAVNSLPQHLPSKKLVSVSHMSDRQQRRVAENDYSEDASTTASSSHRVPHHHHQSSDRSTSGDVQQKHAQQSSFAQAKKLQQQGAAANTASTKTAGGGHKRTHSNSSNVSSVRGSAIGVPSMHHHQHQQQQHKVNHSRVSALDESLQQQQGIEERHSHHHHHRHHEEDPLHNDDQDPTSASSPDHVLSNSEYLLLSRSGDSSVKNRQGEDDKSSSPERSLVEDFNQPTPKKKEHTEQQQQQQKADAAKKDALEQLLKEQRQALEDEETTARAASVVEEQSAARTALAEQFKAQKEFIKAVRPTFDQETVQRKNIDDNEQGDRRHLAWQENNDKKAIADRAMKAVSNAAPAFQPTGGFITRSSDDDDDVKITKDDSTDSDW